MTTRSGLSRLPDATHSRQRRSPLSDAAPTFAAMTHLLVGHADSRSVAHAVHEGLQQALCGTAVESTQLEFPGGATGVCRDCLRASSQDSSSVPQRTMGGRKRSGGM